MPSLVFQIHLCFPHPSPPKMNPCNGPWKTGLVSLHSHCIWKRHGRCSFWQWSLQSAVQFLTWQRNLPNRLSFLCFRSSCSCPISCSEALHSELLKLGRQLKTTSVLFHPAALWSFPSAFPKAWHLQIPFFCILWPFELNDKHRIMES